MFKVFNESHQRELRKVIYGNNGLRKGLVIDKQLFRALKDLILTCEDIKKDTYTGPIALRDEVLDLEPADIVYIIRPELSVLRLAIEQIKHAQLRAMRTGEGVHTYTIYFVPRVTKLCEHVLEENQLSGVTTAVLPIEMICIEDDVMSLEMSHAYRDLFLRGDTTCLYYIAKSLVKIQELFGKIPNIKGKGDNAHQVHQLMQKQMKTAEAAYPNASSNFVPSQIDNLILIDRSVDVVTPMLTQMTYEGLIDELFQIRNSRIVVDEQITGGKGNGRREHLLNSEDSLFDEIRNFNFLKIGSYLGRVAVDIKEVYSERHDAKSVNEMTRFLKKFKSAHNVHTYLQTHINLAEFISKTTRSVKFDRRLEVERFMLQNEESSLVEDYILAAISKQEPYLDVLRLLVLLSQTLGVKRSKYEFFKREFIQTYGYELMFTLEHLEKMGLLGPDRYKFYNSARKSLKLIPQGNFNTPQQQGKPADISYTYSGYAPLAVKLVEIAQRPGWKRMEDVLNSVPGRSFAFKQQAAFETVSRKPTVTTANSTQQQQPASAEKKKQTTLVVFIGGITFAEISALRHLSERENHDQTYLICTTKLINGSSLVHSVKESLPNNLDKQAVLR